MPDTRYIAEGDSTDELLTCALTAYIWWLNEWMAAEKYHPPYNPPPPYKVQSFTEWNPEEGLYGSYREAGRCNLYSSAAFGRILVCFEVSDGDEGGGTDLVAIFEAANDDHTEWQLIYLVQGFDTNLQAIYNRTVFHNRDEVPSYWNSLPEKEEV